MIDPATGMKPGERYCVQSLERPNDFPGFFLDGKYYLDPELLTALGWLEGQRFFYDELDPAGEPVFPDGVAGLIEDLTLTMADGTALPLTKIHVTVPSEADADESDAGPDLAFADTDRAQGWRAATPQHRLLALGVAALAGGCLAALLRSPPDARQRG